MGDALRNSADKLRRYLTGEERYPWGEWDDYEGWDDNTTKEEGPMAGLELWLTHEVSDYITEVVKQVQAEVGGVGYATVEEVGTTKRIIVDEVFLIPQVVSPASVDFTDDAVAIAIERAVEDKRLEDLRFSWHSHANLGVSWSAKDEDGIRKYMTGGAPWLASLVVNKAGDELARLDVQNVPVVERATFNSVRVVHVEPDRQEYAEAVAEDIRAVVEVKTWQPHKGANRPWATEKKNADRAKGQPLPPPKNRQGPVDLRDLSEQEVRALMSGDVDSVSGARSKFVEGSDLSWTDEEIKAIEKHTGKDFGDLSDNERMDAITSVEVMAMGFGSD